MYHIQIVGAGYVGTALAKYYRSKKQKVWAVTRDPEHGKVLAKDEITPVLADLTKPETLASIPPAHFIVISVAPDERDETNYRKIYVEGVGHYLRAIRKNPPPFLVVYLSSTGVYSDRNGEWVDESTPPEPDTERGKILLEAEEQVLRSGFQSLVLRLGGIYGPGRTAMERMQKQPAQKEPDSYTNMIHLDDIVECMTVVFNKGKVGSVYLGVDDEPVLRSEFSKWLAGQTNLQSFQPEPGKITGKRCRNNKLKELGYKFKYPTFREGYKDLLQT